MPQPLVRFPQAGLVVFLLFALTPAFSIATTWVLHTPPMQCMNLTMNVIGLNGSPPYRALIIPFGPSTLKNGSEVRRVIDIPFDDDQETINVFVNYPPGSQFVVAVTDSMGFVTDGTSRLMTVQGVLNDFGDASCFSSPPPMPFSFVINPDQFSQCLPAQISWSSHSLQDRMPTFYGIIPGQRPFVIPMTNVTNVMAQVSYFFWIPPLQAGVEFVVVGGDTNGFAVGRNVSYTVQPSDDVSCLFVSGSTSALAKPTISISFGGMQNALPTSFDFNPLPTEPTGNDGRANRSAGTNAVDIALGTIATFLVVLLLALLYMFLRRRRKQLNAFPVDLLDDHLPSSMKRASRWDQLQENYRPSPFMLHHSPSTDSESVESQKASGHMGCGFPLVRSSPGGSPTRIDSITMPSPTWKGASLKQTGALNIIQHADGGVRRLPLPPGRQWGTIELPPAYTDVKRFLS